jgi:hypothetical protein
LGPVDFVRGAAVGHVFQFWAPSGLYFLQNGPYALIVQFPSQNSWIPAACGYSHNSSYLLDVCPRLDFVTAGTLLSALSSRKVIGIVVFSLLVLGSEIVLLYALNPSGGLSLEVFKIHEPG